MRICICTHSLRVAGGGSSKYFFEISKALMEQGHDVTVVCTENASDRNVVATRVLYVKQFKIPFVGYLMQTMFFGLLSFLRVRKMNFDVLLFENGYLGVWALLFRFFRKPLVGALLRYSPSFLFLNLKTNHKRLRPVYVLWELLFLINEFLDSRIADRIVVLNSESKKLVCGYVGKRGLSKTNIVPYGVDVGVYRRERLDAGNLFPGLGRRSFVFTYVGHLDFARRCELLIPAFALLKERFPRKSLVLLVVGSGHLKHVLESQRRKYKLENEVFFISHVKDQDFLNRLLNISDAAIFTQVPTTSSLLFAATGVPIIGLRNRDNFFSGSPDDLISTFVLFDSPQPQLIADACAKVLENLDLRKSLSEKVFFLSSRYKWENVGVLLSAVLFQVVNNRTGK